MVVPARTAAEPQLVRRLREHAETRPDTVAYEFVESDGDVRSLTYASLARRVGALAARLLDEAPAGDPRPALLLFPPGLDYVAAVFACFVAGVPAVPAYPPVPWQKEAGLRRLEALVTDARPGLALASSEVAPLMATMPLTVPLIEVDDTEPAEAPSLSPHRASDVGLVQYTSGSTQAPRGVVVTHDNLAHNIEAITAAFGVHPDSRAVLWLPPYHDMGLIGGILTPMWVGFPVTLMSPLDFLRRPLAWLAKVSQTRATVTGGPNFAYDLCLKRAAGGDDLGDLDLSSLEVAFNGAEPIRAATMRAFADRFAAHGFRAEAFLPCYGLAEATLMVSGRHWDQRPGDPVSCGSPAGDQRVAIVDPEHRRRLPDGAEGEIWIRGPNVTGGYWSGGNDELFGVLDGGRWLRSGDLGRQERGELHITGRAKDVIVWRGSNYHAADVEYAAVHGMPGLRPVAAAFAVDGPEGPRTVIVVEATSSAGPAGEVATEVRRRVLEGTGLRLDTVVVTSPGSVPRTTSGKVQRGLTRRRFVEGDYARHVEVGAPSGGTSGPAASAPTPQPLVDTVCGVFAAVCAVERCGPDDTLYEIGGDSVRAAEIAGILEGAFGVPVPVTDVLDAAMPVAVAGRILQAWVATGRTAEDLEDHLNRLALEAERANE